MKRKNSILVIALLTFWVGYTALSLTFYSTSLNSLANADTQRKKDNIEYQLENSVEFLVKDQTDSLVARLEAARRLNHFNFFILQKKNKSGQFDVVGYGTNHDNLSGINIAYERFNEWIETPKKDVVFKTSSVFDYRLTIGAVTDHTNYILSAMNEKKSFLLAELFLVTAFSLGLIYFLLKDILSLSKRVQGNKGNLENVRAISSEAQSLLNATRTLFRTGAELKESNQVFSQVITPALRHELTLGTVAPSPFMATLVRLDLNGYTRLFLEKKDAYITQVLNEYFRKSREIIERYDGLIYQYVGDEIVFHIKDKQAKDSCVKALFCVRNLFAIAEEIEKTVAHLNGHEFKIKCSFVHGRLTYIHLDQGFAFTGLPLIESVRMLGAFSEKKENSLTIYSHQAIELAEHLKVEETKDSYFKGFATESEVVMVKQFTPLEQRLGENYNSKLVSLYKTETDLIFWMQRMESDVQKNNINSFFETFAEIKNIKLESASPQFVQCYVNLMKSTMEAFHLDSKKQDFLSAVISIAYNLVPSEAFNQQLFTLFEQALREGDSRTQANALATLSEFDPNSPRYKDFVTASSNRLAANALLIEAKKNLTGEVASEILRFLKSDNPFFIASGLYVIEQTFDFYRKESPVFYETSPYFQELRNASKHFLKSENDMVRKRALRVPGLEDAANQKKAV